MSAPTNFLAADIEDARPRNEFPAPMGHPDGGDVPAGETSGDPNAPYGYTTNGAPRAKPGRKPGQATGTGRSKRRTTVRSATSRRTTTKKKEPEGPDYRPAVTGAAQWVMAPLVVMGLSNPALMADAAAVEFHLDTMADGVHELALEEPQVAAVCERIMAAGPYAKVVGAILAIGAQVMVNHGKIPLALGRAAGAVAPDQLLASFQKRYEQAQAA